jgi:hypothetical protein
MSHRHITFRVMLCVKSWTYCSFSLKTSDIGKAGNWFYPLTSISLDSTPFFRQKRCREKALHRKCPLTTIRKEDRSEATEVTEEVGVSRGGGGGEKCCSCDPLLLILLETLLMYTSTSLVVLQYGQESNYLIAFPIYGHYTRLQAGRKKLIRRSKKCCGS